MKRTISVNKISTHKKSTTTHKAKATSSHRTRRHKKHSNFGAKLEVYAFWTGFISTIISLIQVMVIAMK